MEKEMIVAYVYAQDDFVTKRTLYGVCTILDEENKNKVNVLVDKKIENALWDGKDLGNYWADDVYSSIKKLVRAITAGAEKFKFKSFRFAFNYPDQLEVEFMENSESGNYTARNNILYRERPLNEQERQQFAIAFAALPKGKV